MSTIATTTGVIIAQSRHVTLEAPTYNADNECRECGQHLADPHSPTCPVAQPLDEAECSACGSYDDEPHAEDCPERD